MVSAWGENVSCAAPETSPRYGFFANAIAVVLLLGGGVISFMKTSASSRELGEAVDMWRKDRAEIAEMNARMAIIKRREDYAAAVAAAAAAHGGGGGARTTTRAAHLPPELPITKKPVNHGSRSAAAAPVAASETKLGRTERTETAAESQSPGLQSPRTELKNVDLDVEHGVSGKGKSGVDLPSSSPEGWDSRATPSGEK